jgi:alpha-L-fucosidase 2
VSGLRARGDVTVSIDWDRCGPRQVVLQAGHDGQLTVRSALFEKPYEVRFDKGSKPKSLSTEGQTFTFQARKGGSYTFARAA